MTEVWRNWAGDQHCVPAELRTPSSVEEVAEAVAGAASRGLRVRAAGSGHSFTDCACTDGLMLGLEKLDRILDVDREAGKVRVQAGIRLGDLSRRLDAQGLGLANLGDIDKQTLAGAVSTGTHGTGATFPNISGQVSALQVVLADGTVREISADDDPEAFRAARVAVGALGIVTEATVDVVPSFTLRRVDRPRPLDEVLDGLPELASAHDHFEFYLFPHTRTALCREVERTDEAPTPRSSRSEYLQSVVLENWTIEALGRIGRRFPSTIPPLVRAVSARVGTMTKVDRSHRVFASQRHVRFTEMEYAIPAEHAPEAVNAVMELVDRRSLAVSFPIEVRFTPGDDAFLSTAYGRDTCYVAVHQFHGMPWEPYFRGVEAIMDGFKGRPHWGKRHFQLAATLRSRYPKWSAFQDVRHRLDPDGVFGNEYTDRVLGPVRAPRKAKARA